MIDVFTFRAPPGTVALTIDVRGTPPSSIVIDAAKLVDATTDVARRGLNYYKAVPFIARQFVRARRRRDDKMLQSVGQLAFWSALHHPKAGTEMRAAVSDALRRGERAHITWNYSKRYGLVMALASAFVDLDAVSEKMPKDRIVMLARPRPARQADA